MTGDLTTHFQRLERMFEAYFAAADLPEADAAEVQHYIDHAEYGMALETAVCIHLQPGRGPSAQLLALLAEMAVAMELRDELRSEFERLVRDGATAGDAGLS